MTYGRGYQASMQLFNRLYSNVPYFTDVFDEETFYVFAFFFVIGSFALAFLLSRFIKVEECDW